MTKIDIIVSYDKIYKNIVDTFLLSSFHKYNMEKDFEIIENSIKIPKKNIDFGYTSKLYFDCKIQHIEYIIKYIKNQLLKNNTKKYAISMDVDCLIFKEFNSIIKNIIDHDTKNNIYFMSEGKNRLFPNLGFILFPITNEILLLFEYLLSVYKQKNKNMARNISILTKNFLSNHEMPYSILDLRFMNNNYSIEEFKNKIIHSKLACFHSTNTKNILEKINILSSIALKIKSLKFVDSLPNSYQDWITILSRKNNLRLK